MIAAWMRRTGAPPASGTAAIWPGAIRTLSAWATVTPRPAATNACASTGSSPWPACSSGGAIPAPCRTWSTSRAPAPSWARIHVSRARSRARTDSAAARRWPGGSRARGAASKSATISASAGPGGGGGGAAVAGRQQGAGRVVEERDDLDVVGRRRVRRLEGVLEDEGEVELARPQAAQRRRAVDERVLDDLPAAGEELGVARLELDRE